MICSAQRFDFIQILWKLWPSQGPCCEDKKVPLSVEIIASWHITCHFGVQIYEQYAFAEHLTLNFYIRLGIEDTFHLKYQNSTVFYIYIFK